MSTRLSRSRTPSCAAATRCCGRPAPDAHAAIEAAGMRVVAAGLPRTRANVEYFDRYPEAHDLSPQELPAHLFPRSFGEIAVPAMLDATPDRRRRLGARHHRARASASSRRRSSRPARHPARRGRFRRTRATRNDSKLSVESVERYWRGLGLEPTSHTERYDDLFVDIYPPVPRPGLRRRHRRSRNQCGRPRSRKRL